MEAVHRGLDLASARFIGSPKEILIIGTGHEAYQIRPQNAPLDGSNAFKVEIDEIIRHYGPAAIAEEMNLEALNGRKTIDQEIAAAYGLDHILCEPDHRERQMLGITDDDNAVSRQRREAEWAHRLNDKHAGRILVICGATHVELFYKTLP